MTFSTLREDVLDEAGEFHEGQGCMGGRFNDDGISCCQAGASFQHAMVKGKFQGMTWPTTPTGSWRMRERVLSSSMVAEPSHARRHLQSSGNGRCPGECRSLGFTDGLAVVQCFHQCQMVCIASMMSAIFSRIFCLSMGEVLDQAGRATLAAFTALSTSSLVASAK